MDNGGTPDEGSRACGKQVSLMGYAVIGKATMSVMDASRTVPVWSALFGSDGAGTAGVRWFTACPLCDCGMNEGCGACIAEVPEDCPHVCRVADSGRWVLVVAPDAE